MTVELAIIDYVLIGDKIDELHELISDEFAEPLKPFPYRDDLEKVLAADYFAWLDNELSARTPAWELLSWDNDLDDNLHVVIVRRSDTDRIITLAGSLSLRVSTAIDAVSLPRRSILLCPGAGDDQHRADRATIGPRASDRPHDRIDQRRQPEEPKRGGQDESADQREQEEEEQQPAERPHATERDPQDRRQEEHAQQRDEHGGITAGPLETGTENVRIDRLGDARARHGDNEGEHQGQQDSHAPDE
ncbi:hypothetical protein ACQR50_15330 [Sphingomonas sp. Xoc002]|uniref:hypothetical protein n=1 Tax=Sphingomonas sp. Xoc002 TaxID=2837624 RepID=UPI003D17E0BC